MSLNKKELTNFIKIPNLKKFIHLSEEEKQHLEKAIYKIKENQMVSLIRDIYGIVYAADYPSEILTSLLDLSTLNVSLKIDALTKIFELKPEAEDEQIKMALKGLNIADQDGELYNLVYRFRHQYFLNKPYRVKDNAKAFPESISERFLGKGHSHVSRFFKKDQIDLTESEAAVLDKAYPAADLEKKTFRREAHLDISLSLLEIQCLIVGAVNKVSEAVIKGLEIPTEQYGPGVPSQNQSIALTLYTKLPMLACLYQNQLGIFKTKYEQFAHSLDYSTGITFLSYAVKLQNLDFIRYFLERKVNVNVTDNLGYTALHYAMEGDDEKIVDELLAIPDCNVNIADQGGYTCIYIAAERGKANYVKKLLDRNANPNLANNRFMSTPLHIATRNCQQEVVQVLLESNKINSDLQDKMKLTAKEIAKGRSESIFKLLDNYKNPLPGLPISIPANIVSTLKPPLANNVQAMAFLQQKIQQMSNIKPGSLPSVNGLPPGMSFLKPPAPLVQVGNLPPGIMRPNQPLTVVKPSNEALKKLLLNPKESKPFLTTIIKIYQKAENPFPISLSNNVESTISKPVHNAFFAMMEEEEKIPLEAKAIFQQHVEDLQSFPGQKITFAQGYFRILKIIERVRSANLSLIAFAFEIYRHGYLEYLINLKDNKTPLQIAIEGEDVDCMKEILSENPVHDFMINYKDKEMTEFEYAIQLGKVNAVVALLELAEKNKLINLGVIPLNAVSSAEGRQKEIGDLNPAFKEADEYHDVDIPKVAELNAARLFKHLIATLPEAEMEVANTFFTKDEYKVFRVLIGEKETNKEPLFKKFVRKCKAERNLQFRLNEINVECEKLADKIDEESQRKYSELEKEKHLVSTAIQRLLSTPYYQSYKLLREAYSIQNNEPRCINVFKHATSNYTRIAQDQKLSTVQSVLTKGVVRFQTSTPMGTRANIFFSQNSPLTTITPLRGKAQHVIELKIAQAIHEKILKAEDVYTSPHIPAFKIERVEPPIVFIGDDITQKTIYRVYHYRENGKNMKAHWYDYYKDNSLIGSHHELYDMEEEFFLGDNIKQTAYRFILHIRNTKGPFSEGSYYHYILKNAHNVDVLDSAKAAFFNVLNIEGKITRDIPIPNAAVTVIENEKTKQFINITSEITLHIEELVVKNDPQKLIEYISSFKIPKEQLDFAILKAVLEQKIDSLSCLLDYGVNLDFENNKLLNTAVNQMNKVYMKSNRNLESEEFSVAFNIVWQLLYHGSGDVNDSQHIRRTASGDNFGPNSRLSLWTNMTEIDLLELKKYILKFDEYSLQMLMFSGITKHLLALYEYTFQLGYFELHKFIAERMQSRNQQVAHLVKSMSPKEKIPLMDNQINRELLSYVDKNDVSSLLDFLTTKVLKVEHSKYYFVFSYALKIGNLDIVAACYPYFKNQSFSDIYPPLHAALKYKNYALVNKLLELGAEPKQRNLLGQDALEVAFLYQCDQAMTLLVDGITDVENSLVAAIAANLIAFVEKLAAKVDVTGILNVNLKKEWLNDNITPVIKPLIMALQKGDLDCFKILKEAYKAKLSDKSQHLRIVMYVCSLHALRLQKKDILLSLFPELTDTKSISLFTNKTKFFPGEIVKLADIETLKSLFSLIESKKEKLFSTTNTQGMNCLHIAVETCDLEKIKFIHKALPFLKFITSEVNAAFVFSSVSLKEDNTDILDYLINNGCKLPETLSEKIEILADALIYYRPNIINWIFAKNILDSKFTDENGKNLLQLLLGYFNEHATDYLKVQDVDLFKKGLNYLCDTYKIDVNHRDNNNHYAVLTPILSQTSLLRAFQEFLIENPSSNLTVKDENDNTLLHLLFHYSNFSSLVDRFLLQGGDINATNKEGRTPFEIMLMCTHSKKENILVLKSKNAKASNYIVSDKLKMGVITCDSENQTYVLVRGKSAIIHNLENFDPVYHFVSDEKDANITLGHFDKGSYKKLPAPNKLLGDGVTNCSWMKMPTKYEQRKDASFDALFENDNIEVGSLVKSMLEHISQHQATPVDVSKKKGDKQYVLSADQYAEMILQAKKMIEELNAIYLPIIGHQTPNIHLNDISRIIRLSGFPFSVLLRISEDSYDSFVFYSPIAAAVMVNDIALVNYFLSNDVSFVEDGIISALKLGVHYNFTEIAATLVKFYKKFTAECMFECFNECLLNVEKEGVGQDSIRLTLKLALAFLEYCANLKVSEPQKRKFNSSLGGLGTYMAEKEISSEVKADFEVFIKEATSYVEAFRNTARKPMQKEPSKGKRKYTKKEVESPETSSDDESEVSKSRSASMATNLGTLMGNQAVLATNLPNNTDFFRKRKSEEDGQKHERLKKPDSRKDDANGSPKSPSIL